MHVALAIAPAVLALSAAGAPPPPPTGPWRGAMLPDLGSPSSWPEFTTVFQNGECDEEEQLARAAQLREALLLEHVPALNRARVRAADLRRRLRVKAYVASNSTI